jgi:hypothetical protein
MRWLVALRRLVVLESAMQQFLLLSVGLLLFRLFGNLLLCVPALVSTVPASSGNVSVLSVFVAGLLIVNTPVPEALGVILILLMAYPIKASSVNAFSSSGVVAAAIRASDVTSRSACLSVAMVSVSPLSSKALI